MVRRNRNLAEDASIEAEPLIDDVATRPPDANAAIRTWLNVFTRLVHLPDSQRSAIRNELQEHLRERTRDLMLAGRTETESVRLAIEELGETVQLARRFEAANRPHTRRWLMYASMLGFGAAVIITGTVVLTPNQQTQSLATVFQQEYAEPDDAVRRLAEKKVDISNNQPLVEAVRAITKAADCELVMSKAEFQEHGIDINDHFIELDLSGVPASVALDRIVADLSGKGGPFAWRADQNTVEITLKERLDVRDSVLVSYRIDDIIHGITTYGRKYDHATADVRTLLFNMVEADSWRENGGALAHLQIVGGRMFVQAPKRMHTQIEWILDQLRQDGVKPAANLELPAEVKE